jgi:hypothetical protein
MAKKKKARPPSIGDMREAARLFATLGGRARMEKLTPEERAALGKKAGKASGEARRRKRDQQ